MGSSLSPRGAYGGHAEHCPERRGQEGRGGVRVLTPQSLGLSPNSQAWGFSSWQQGQARGFTLLSRAYFSY